MDVVVLTYLLTDKSMRLGYWLGLVLPGSLAMKTPFY